MKELKAKNSNQFQMYTNSMKENQKLTEKIQNITQTNLQLKEKVTTQRQNLQLLSKTNQSLENKNPSQINSIS
jgi:hypothetical protein